MQRALTADPHYQLALLLGDALSVGLPPTALHRATQPDESTEPHQTAAADSAPSHTSSDATDGTAGEDRA